MAKRISMACLGFDDEPDYFKPSMVSQEHLSELFVDVPTSVRDWAKQCIRNGWRIYTVSQRRGRCYPRQKVITIPVWVITLTDKPGKKIWYISHELAHAMDECRHNHGPEFMEWLKTICPEEHLHWELGYKPRNARAAGIDPF